MKNHLIVFILFVTIVLCGVTSTIAQTAVQSTKIPKAIPPPSSIEVESAMPMPHPQTTTVPPTQWKKGMPHIAPAPVNGVPYNFPVTSNVSGNVAKTVALSKAEFAKMIKERNIPKPLPPPIGK